MVNEEKIEVPWDNLCNIYPQNFVVGITTQRILRSEMKMDRMRDEEVLQAKIIVYKEQGSERAGKFEELKEVQDSEMTEKDGYAQIGGRTWKDRE